MTVAHHVRIMRQIGAARRPRKRLPRQQQPNGIRREYAKALVAKLGPVMRQAFTPLLAELPHLFPHHDTAHLDAGQGGRIRAMIAQARAQMRQAFSPTDVENLARKFTERTATWQRIQLGNQLRAGLGVDPFISDHPLRGIIADAVHENVALIESITPRVADQIETMVLTAFNTAQRHEQLAADIEQRFVVGEDRAKLIARDQIGKVYGDVNRARQENLGVTGYIWRTSNDERVREEHALREGDTFQWNDPPEDGPPGQPINCRCYAEPILSDILGEAEAE